MRSRSLYIALSVIVSIIAGAGIAWSDTLTIPNTFVANTPAVADEVNANFSACKTAVDDNDSRVAALESAVSVATG